MARKEEQASEFDEVRDEEVAGDSSTYYEETVVMQHPDLEDSKTTTTKDAYDEVWAEKGWVIVEETEEIPPPTTQGQGTGSGEPRP